MKTIQVNNIQQLAPEVLNNNELQVLKISNSTLSLPADIGKMQQLKELHLCNNSLGNLPVELFDLENTFVFMEDNLPATSQVFSVIMFDLQRKKISKPQAQLYLNLLQNNNSAITTESINALTQAVSYRLPEVRKAALASFKNLSAAINEIPQGATVSLMGIPARFKLEDLRHRMKNVSVGIQNKITDKTTHIVVCENANLTDTKLNKYILLSEEAFLDWLNTADKQLLGDKAEGNQEALENVSAMLLGDDPEHVEMALTMMKTHGVSSELLTDLFIFFLDTNDKKLKNRARNLIKKYAPQDLLQYMADNDMGLTGDTDYICGADKFYDYLVKNPVLDYLKIGLHLQKNRYLDLAKDKKQRVEFLKNIMNGDSLDISWDLSKKIEDAIITVNNFKAINFYYTDYRTNLAWLSKITIQQLDLFNSGYFIEDDFPAIESLKNVRLPNNYHDFPAVFCQMLQLETIELGSHQFTTIPESIKQLTQLKTILLHKLSRWEDPIEPKKFKAIEALLPAGCEIKMVDKPESRY